MFGGIMNKINIIKMREKKEIQGKKEKIFIRWARTNKKMCINCIIKII
jgi:hypothetical protein